MSLKNSNDTIGNRTRDLPVCSLYRSALTTTPPRPPPIIDGRRMKYEYAALVERSRQGKSEVFGDTYPSAILSTLNLTWICLGCNLDLCFEAPVTDHLIFRQNKAGNKCGNKGKGCVEDRDVPSQLIYRYLL